MALTVAFAVVVVFETCWPAEDVSEFWKRERARRRGLIEQDRVVGVHCRIMLNSYNL